ncbi:MAG TPA: peroxiredoxin [Candidatus Binataceae bacterium]|nr:peroxiredoxin [Candidatus Binataceae bacterium]
MPPRAEEIRNAGLGDSLALELPDQHGQMRRLGDFRGRNVVLYFYPRDNTPGCTVEGKEFRELHEQFLGLDCAVIGVSTDSVSSHREFAEQHGLHFPLLADTNGELASAFGVLENGMAQRATFVLDREGRLARAFLEVTPRGHAQRVLNFVRTLLESHRMLGG